MAVVDIDMEINCVLSPDYVPYKQLSINIKNSPKRMGALNRAFAEALKNIRFCNTIERGVVYKGKKGLYELMAIINYPFDFPDELFKRHFIRSVNNSLMKTITFGLPTIDKAYCLMKRLQVFFDSVGLQPKKMFVDKTRLTVQYECHREKHLLYSKTLDLLWDKIKKSTDWVIDKGYIAGDEMAVESLIKLTGFTGKYHVETRLSSNIATITTESMEEADEFIKLYLEMKIYHDLYNRNSFFIWDSEKDLTDFLSKYNGIIYKTVNEVRWVITDYEWVVDYIDGCKNATPLPVTYISMNSIFLVVFADMDVESGYYKYFNYRFTNPDAEVEKLLYFLFQIDAFHPRIYHGDNSRIVTIQLYVIKPGDLAECINKYHREKNTISVLTATSLNNNFETRMIEKSIKQKFKSCSINFYPYRWIEGDLKVEYVAIIGECGKATLRRVKKIIEAGYEEYKKKFLLEIKGKEEVEIFSQENLQDIEAGKFPYLCCLDSQYYDIKELGKYIESTEEPVLPHSRRPFTEEDFEKIASVACDGVEL